MSEDDAVVGERRSRREAERAAAAGSEGTERPLTRRELRARETALETGALQLDETGEIRVIEEPPRPPEPDPLDLPATGVIGLTRRQLRELRERQAAAGKQATAGEKSTPSPAAVPTPVRGLPPAADSATETPTPPVRRPIVRPPATAGAVRSLARDRDGLAPVDRTPRPPSDPASPAEWADSPTASVDVTGTIPPIGGPVPGASAASDDDRAIIADPGPLPTTRRMRRVAQESMQLQAAPPPSLDALIAGEGEEPQPFDATPSWPELPPPTPADPMPVVGAPEPEQAITGVEEPGVIEVTELAAPAATADDHGENDAEIEDDEIEADEHRTPRWLTALMILVLVVIGIVLGLLVWRLVQGDGGAGAVAAIWQGGHVTHGAMR